MSSLADFQPLCLLLKSTNSPTIGMTVTKGATERKLHLKQFLPKKLLNTEQIEYKMTD